MNSREAHKIRIEQCEAAQAVRARFGVKAAFDYIVGEKLINFAAAASQHPAFAQELPRFISEVRRMFTPEEIEAQLTRIERERNEMDEDVADEDDPLGDSPASIAERTQRFMAIRELLTATNAWYFVAGPRLRNLLDEVNAACLFGQAGGFASSA